jgi:DNA mismatch repair protein MSH5
MMDIIQTVYYKCDEMRVLDTDVGDLDGLIKDREKMIFTDLEELILQYEMELRESFDALSELDCILSFVECAVDLNFTRPTIVDRGSTCSRVTTAEQQQAGPVVYIKDGRHPLQEVFTDREFVPNDVHIDNQDRVIVITGPNYSGKSCYLRQVGVLVYMAHLGSYIPSSPNAIISLTDQICARIATIETCTRPQSSYQLELTEMASILHSATPRSLVLIDEFGKGTNPASGIAVLGAALKKLSTIGCATVCTTHFLELFSMDVIHDQQNGIRARQMTIHLPNCVDDDAEPLFKLRDGVASSSAGLICARNAGISHKVIDRAKEIIQAMRSKNGGVVIQPLREAMPNDSIIPQFSQTEEEMLTYFASIESWGAASKAELKNLVQYVQDMHSQNESNEVVE